MRNSGLRERAECDGTARAVAQGLRESDWAAAAVAGSTRPRPKASGRPSSRGCSDRLRGAARDPIATAGRCRDAGPDGRLFMRSSQGRPDGEWQSLGTMVRTGKGPGCAAGRMPKGRAMPERSDWSRMSFAADNRRLWSVERERPVPPCANRPGRQRTIERLQYRAGRRLCDACMIMVDFRDCGCFFLIDESLSTTRSVLFGEVRE